jgi:hypothetical protein
MEPIMSATQRPFNWERTSNVQPYRTRSVLLTTDAPEMVADSEADLAAALI